MSLFFSKNKIANASYLSFLIFLLSIPTFFISEKATSSSKILDIKQCGKFFYNDSEKDTAKKLLDQATLFPRLSELNVSHQGCASCGLRGALEILSFNSFSETKYIGHVIELMAPIVLFHYYENLQASFLDDNAPLEDLLKPIKPPFEIAYSSEDLEKIFNLAMILFETNQQESFKFFSNDTMASYQKALTRLRGQTLNSLIKHQQKWIKKYRPHVDNIIDADSVFKYFQDVIEELKFYAFLSHSHNLERMARGETIKKPIMYPEKKVKLTPIAFPSWMEFLDSVEAATMSVLKDENEILSLVEKSIISQDHVYLLHSFEPETLLTPSSSKKSVARWAHWSDAIYWHESHFSKRDLESSQHMFVVVGFFKSKSENFNIDKDHLENWSYLVVADLINGRVGSLDGLRILPFSYIMEQGIDLIKVEWVPFSKEGLF